MILLERIAYHESGHCAAAIAYGVPIIDVNIDSATPRLHRGDYRAPVVGLGIEAMTVLCLSGPAAEEFYCGSITHDSDRGDLADARKILRRHYSALEIGFELNRLRDSARALVTTPWARARIPVLADALLRFGTLNAEQIVELMHRQ